MGLWTYDTPPNWVKEGQAVATVNGWEDKDTGEVYVAIRGHNTRSETGAADVVGFLDLADTEYTDAGENLDISVVFNEEVDVTGTPLLPITVGGAAKNASFVSGDGTNVLVFRYVTEAAVTGVVAVAGDIDLNAGTIQDAGTATASNLTVDTTQFQDDVTVVAA